MNHHSSDSRRSAGKRQFATTQWSVVLSAGECVGEESGDDAAAAALAQLCEDYWYPLYFYVRRRGYAVADAQDLTHRI
nr:hypothetical protein [Rhodopirellula sp. SM50]